MEENIRRLKDDQPKAMNGAGEPLVVHTSDLAPVLNAWRKRYDIEHDVEYHMREGRNHKVFGPLQYLSHQSGINPRQIHLVMKEVTKFTSLAKAERLLMAIDREYMLKTGEIPTVPNPHWKFETWVEYMQRAGC